MAAQTVLILDFGGQYKELIARRVRECGVYSIVKPGDISLDKIPVPYTHLTLPTILRV